MNLGEMLRDARIAARISIEDLSNATSIRIGLLTEMEANNFAHCGGDTYARGHIRNIANKLGADAAALIDIFNEEHSTERRAMQDLLVENNVMNSRPEGKKISWKVPAVISLSILVVLGIIQIVISNQSSTPKPVASQSVATPSPTPSAETAPQPSASAQPSAQPSATTSRKGPITLMMVATRGSSYIDIIVDGKRVLKGSIFQGETKKFTGKSAISIYLSNPGGLDVTLNGKLLTNLGGENEEVRRTFR